MKSGPQVSRQLFSVSVAFTLCLCLSLSAVAATPAGQMKGSPQPQISKELEGQISGHVYRSDTGEPIPKAEVSLTPEDEDTSKAAGGNRIVRTSSDGSFVFSDVPPGSYALDVWRNGFANYSCQRNRECRQLSLHVGQKLENMVLRLTPAGIVAGQVSDEDQEPVAGIEVYALRINFLRGGRREISAMSRVVTDDQGNFRISIEPGRYYLRAGGLIEREMQQQVAVKQGPSGRVEYQDTYYPGTPVLDEAKPIAVGPGVEANDIRFSIATEKTYTVTGKIVNTEGRSGRKASDISVTKWIEAAEQMFGFAPGVSLSPDGSFTVAGLPQGEYTLTAMTITNEGREVDQGYALVRIVDSDVRANIEIGRAAEVRGKVEPLPGFSFAGEQVILQTNGLGYHPSNVDSSGRFDIVNVPPGEYTLSMKEAGDRPQLTYLQKAACGKKDYALQPLVIGVGTVLDCEILIANDTGVVSGQVMDGEKPASGLTVVMIPESSELRPIPRYTLTGTTDTAGRYKLVGAVPGEYLLFALPPSDDHPYFALDFADRNRPTAEHIRVAARATVVVDLKPSRNP